MARSSFYYHEKQNKLPDKYKITKELIQTIYHKHKGRYGYRRITHELENKGIQNRFKIDEVIRFKKCC